MRYIVRITNEHGDAVPGADFETNILKDAIRVFDNSVEDGLPVMLIDTVEGYTMSKSDNQVSFDISF